jgi:hypothetical protein
MQTRDRNHTHWLCGGAGALLVGCGRVLRAVVLRVVLAVVLSVVLAIVLLWIVSLLRFLSVGIKRSSGETSLGRRGRVLVRETLLLVL